MDVVGCVFFFLLRLGIESMTGHVIQKTTGVLPLANGFQ